MVEEHDAEHAVGSNELVLGIERVLAADRESVFAAFTDPEQLVKWWGPGGFEIPSLDFEPRVGASYRIEMQPPEGDSFRLTGEFREVVPLERLAFTFVWEPADPDDVETLATLVFRDRGQSTEVRLTQDRFKTAERRNLHRDGWRDSLDKLERTLAGS